jgi:hypothetical protein
MSCGTNVADMFRQVGAYTGSDHQGRQAEDAPEKTIPRGFCKIAFSHRLGHQVPPRLAAVTAELAS